VSDIKTVWKIDSGGWVSETGDLTSGDDLDTAVFISLFTDQQARADDTYDGDDRRGWWGDLGEDYCIGSRLWLIYRQRLSRDTAGAVINRKDGIKYTLNNSVTIGLDGTALTPVTAVLVSPLDDPAAGGALGNAPVGTVLTLDNSYSGVDSQVTLMNPATGGANVETDGPLRTRMLLAYQALPQGGSETDYVNWALAVSGVTRAWCVRRLMGVGTVGIYIMCDGDDQTNHGFPAGTDGLSHYEDWGSYAKATGDQLRVADAIYPNQTITALVYVASPIPKVIDFAITGIIEQEQDLTAAISTAINLVFFTRGDPAGEGIVTLSSINAAIASAPGTDGFLMTSPTQNITLGVGELPQLGTVTIT